MLSKTQHRRGSRVGNETTNPDIAMAREGLVAGFQFYNSDSSAYVVPVNDMDGSLWMPAYAQGVGPTLTIGATSTPDTRYQVRANYLNSSSTNQIHKVDLMKGIDIASPLALP